MSNHEDAVFVRNFSMVLVGLCVVGIMAFILAKIVNRSFQDTQSPSETIASRIAPLGQVNTGDAAIAMAKPPASADSHADSAPTTSATPTSSDPGQAAYDKVCFACHALGIAGAPKYGDMAAWEARLPKGREANIANAINGYTGTTGMMPAKGGNPSMSDEDVAAAVDYMLAAVGGKADSAATAEPAPAVVAAAVVAATAETIEVASSAGRGKDVYDAACFVCHATGAAGAPKLGDAATWKARIEKGTDVLYHSSINGFMGAGGLMPPKGGRPDFSDDDVKAAVDYMVGASQ